MTAKFPHVFIAATVALTVPQALADDETVIAPSLEVIGTPVQPLEAASERASLPLTAVENASEAFGNLHISGSGAGGFGTLTSLRGLSNTPYFGDAAVTVYLDDLPLAGGFATPATLFGFDQAELYRGSAGSFATGRGGAGGTLLLRSQAERSGHFAFTELAYGDHGTKAARASGTWNTRRWSASGALAWETDDGFLSNLVTKQKVDSHDHRFASLNLRYRPSADAEISFQGIVTKAKDGAQPLVPLGSDWHTVSRTADGRLDATFSGVALRGTKSTDLGVLSSITSFTEWSMSPYENLLNIPIPFHSVLRQRQSSLNEELRLRSLESAKFPWAAGLWFSDATTKGQADRGIVFGQEIPYEASTYRNTARTFAAYGETVLMTDEGWTLTGGLRAETTRKTTDRLERLAESGSWNARRSDSFVQPRLSASWTMDAKNVLNLSWSHAAKPGGYSAYTANQKLGTFEDERTQAFEGSWRSRTSRSSMLTLRGFYYKISDYQIERSFSDADYIVVNAPHARSVGAELEGNLDFSEQLSLRLSGGLQKVVVLPYTDPVSQTLAAGNKRAPYAPASSVRATLVYTEGNWSLEAGGVRVGRTFFDERETALYSQDSYITADATLRYRRGRWTAAVTGTNLFDKGYYTLIVPGIDHGAAGAPRTLLGSLSYRW